MKSEATHVLIVEDDAFMVEVHVTQLQQAGFEVSVLKSGESAVDHVESKPCDLVLMDIDLGEGSIDGIETARRILLTKDVPIVFLACPTQQQMIEQAEVVGAYGVVIKDSGEELLKASVKMALRLHRAHLHAREQKRELRASEEKFRVAFKTSVDAVNINRMRDGLYVEINEGFTRTTGYTEQDVLGKTSVDLGIWADAEDRQRLVQLLREHGVVENLEARFRLKDGGEITASMSARIIEFDGEPHILSITRDITEAKQRTEELMRSEERFREIVGNTSAGYFRVDAEGRYEAVNDAWLRMHGYDSQSEVVGMSLVEKAGVYRARACS